MEHQRPDKISVRWMTKKLDTYNRMSGSDTNQNRDHSEHTRSIIPFALPKSMLGRLAGSLGVSIIFVISKQTTISNPTLNLGSQREALGNLTHTKWLAQTNAMCVGCPVVLSYTGTLSQHANHIHGHAGDHIQCATSRVCVGRLD